MTLTIDLSPELVQRLSEEAARVGLRAEEYAVRTLEDRLGTRKSKALIDLLDSWRREDATDDPAELEARRRSLEEFKTALDENRSSERKLFP